MEERKIPIFYWYWATRYKSITSLFDLFPMKISVLCFTTVHNGDFISLYILNIINLDLYIGVTSVWWNIYWNFAQCEARQCLVKNYNAIQIDFFTFEIICTSLWSGMRDNNIYIFESNVSILDVLYSFSITYFLFEVTIFTSYKLIVRPPLLIRVILIINVV